MLLFADIMNLGELISMMGKRFTKVENIYDMGDEGVKDNQTKIEYYYALDMIELLNAQHETITRLKDRIDDLEDDNERYCLGEGKPVLENPRFKVTGCPYEIKDTSNNHYYWLEHQENVKEMCRVLNSLYEEIMQWKSEKVELLEENITYKNAWLGLKDERDEQCEEIKSLTEQLRNLRRLSNEIYMEGSE